MMQERKRILWLDNDIALLRPYEDELRRQGYEVRVTETLGEAKGLLETELFDLLILDVMIPTLDAQEEEDFPPDRTDRGYLSGLEFYRVMKESRRLEKTIVLVLTIRADTRERFLKAGLPPGRFSTRFDLSRLRDFVGKVAELLAEAP